MAIDTDHLLSLTADIVTAFLGNNDVAITQVPELINGIHHALTRLGAEPSAAPEQEYVPAVSARKSLADPAHIQSMIDGKPYKSLNRHLRAKGITPVEYRQRYKLPVDYPMVSAAYSEQRRSFAKQIGLDRKRSEAGEQDAATLRPASERQAGTVEAGGTGEGAATRTSRTRKLSGKEALAKVRAKAAKS